MTPHTPRHRLRAFDAERNIRAGESTIHPEKRR
jgi:hypothetical protein